MTQFCLRICHCLPGPVWQRGLISSASLLHAGHGLPFHSGQPCRAPAVGPPGHRPAGPDDPGDGSPRRQGRRTAATPEKAAGCSAISLIAAPEGRQQPPSKPSLGCLIQQAHGSPCSQVSEPWWYTCVWSKPCDRSTGLACHPCFLFILVDPGLLRFEGR